MTDQLEIKDENIMRTIKKIELCLESELDRRSRTSGPAMGPTAAQCNILGYLYTHKEQTVCSSDLCIKLGISRAAISSTLKRMRREGYLEFQNVPEDDRQKQIVLTSKGTDQETKMEKCFKEVQSIMYIGFSDEEKTTLENLLQKIYSNLKQERTRKKIW